MVNRTCSKLFLLILCFVFPLLATAEVAEIKGAESYDQDTVLNEARQFFGEAAEDIAKVVAKAFQDYGRPNGYIKGEEAAGALGVGVRYGDGTLYMVNGETRKLHWQGPSIGLDFGGAASKVLILVYKLPAADNIYDQFTGVEGSLFLVAGAGINYLRKDDVVLSPIRVGLGWRHGANIGYINITKEKTWKPF